MRIFHATLYVVPAGAGYSAVPLADLPEGAEREPVTGWWIEIEGERFGAFANEAEARAEAAWMLARHG
jgi:hypothetical protein